MGSLSQVLSRGTTVSARLIITGSVITERFGALINCLVEVLHDVCCDDDGVFTDSLIIHQDESESACEKDDTQHDTRKRLLSKQDPVHTVCLKSYLVSQLNACQQTHGQAGFDQLMSQVDPEVMKQLQPFCG